MYCVEKSMKKNVVIMTARIITMICVIFCHTIE